jgi:pyruvate/2-oxoglutarate dehydrogenase complex dihydrolipoamide acyltransferase (E2) component
MAGPRKPRGAAAAKANAAPPVVAGFPPYKPQPEQPPAPPPVQPPPPAPPAPPAEPELTAADRENPAKLSGEALRRLAHQRGIARSEADGMSDEKLRMQLGYIIARQYAEAD